MENITVLRRANLLWLLQNFVQSQVGEGAAPKGLEQMFAAHLQISPSRLSQIKSARPISDKLARQIDVANGKPLGWLDTEHVQALTPSPAEERFIKLARNAWRQSNAAGKRTLMKSMMQPSYPPAS
jgi:hypothetical protein